MYVIACIVFLTAAAAAGTPVLLVTDQGTKHPPETNFFQIELLGYRYRGYKITGTVAPVPVPVTAWSI